MARFLAAGLLALSSGLGAQPAPAFPLLEFRRLASLDRPNAEVDLRAERVRLLAWLARDGTLARVQRDPLAVHGFNAARSEQGGPLHSTVRWYPLVVSDRRPPLGDAKDGALVVRLYDAAQLAAAKTFGVMTLVELCPVLLSEPGFDQGDIDPGTVGVADEPRTGQPALYYAMLAPRAAAYADWTESLIGERTLQIARGRIESTPIIMSRIPGMGAITGGLDEKELTEMCAILRGERAPPPMPPPSGVLDKAAARQLVDEARRLGVHLQTLKAEGTPTPRFVPTRGWVSGGDEDEPLTLPHRVTLAGELLPEGGSGGFVLVPDPWRAAVGSTAPGEPVGLVGNGLAGPPRLVVVEGDLAASTSGPWRFTLSVTRVVDVPH